MSHSVVKVTENQGTDSLLLVVAEDGTVTPDKATVESYLKNRPGATELQVMHVNTSNGQNIDVTLDTLMYIHSEEVGEGEETITDMDDIRRSLVNFRLDHDYTPLTSPRNQSPVTNDNDEDELAQTLSMLEGTTEVSSKPIKLVKTYIQKVGKKIPPPSTAKQKAKMITTLQTPASKPPIKQQPHTVVSKVVRQPPKQTAAPEGDETEESDQDFDEIDFEDDDDSDFELQEVAKLRSKRMRGKKPTKITDNLPRLKVKAVSKTQPKIEKVEVTPPKVEKEPEVKQPDKKSVKKEKKIPKPPDDFALFSTPDIIRRVGGKEPSTPTTPEAPKSLKPAKIMFENRSKSSEHKSPTKRQSTDQKQRISLDEKHPSLPNSDKTKRLDKPQISEKKPEQRLESRVSVQGYDESLGSNSSESMLEPQLEPMPSAEDIRAIIQNENTKSFTTSMVIPDASDLDSANQSHDNLESAGLDLDQSILDNINTDLISEDILYQVAQSLADNPDLQNVIDKSIVDGNLILDPALQQAINEDDTLQHNQTNNLQLSVSSIAETSTPNNKGTQIVRPDGRVVVLPPIERPTTRSRNKRGSDSQEVRQVTRPVKPLDEEHVSGNELDSSGEEEESEDDPNKLWCICNQPHNNRFMICCDTCEEWYHGKCVNVTKAMGQLMEQNGKEWICLYCRDSSLKRPTAAARRVRKASRASRTSTDSASSLQKSTSALPVEPQPKVPGCIVCGKPSRNSSIYCSDGCILKHAQGVEKVVVFERKTGKILSGNSAPSAANLDKWLQEHPGFEVIRSTSNPNTVNKKMTQSKLQFVKNKSDDGVSLAVNKKGVNVGVLQHAPKHPQGSPKILNKITGIKILTKQVSLIPQKTTKLIQPVPITKPPTTPTTPTTTPSKPKVLTQKTLTTPSPKDKPIMKTPKARQAELGNQAPKQENIRENVRKTLMEQLTNRIKMVTDLKLTEEEITNISTEIENQLFKCFGDTGQKYRNKYRSLIFNIKDVKNQTLWRRICEKSINPYQLVRLSPDDLASQELALWRERETKHQLDMIKKSELELLNCNRQYVFKTHKGEQVFEDDRPNDHTVTDVITGLNTETTVEKEEAKKEAVKEKDKDKKSFKHKRNRSRDRKSSKEKSDIKERRKDRRSISRDRDKDRSKDREKDRDKRKRSKSREHSSRHNERKRSRSRDRDRDRHKRSSHKSSRHKKENTTEKLDKKSKEILEQLVDKQIVPPLEDKLWKHVPQEDILPTANIESDSDHEPTSTVTIPTPPRNIEPDDLQTNHHSSDTAKVTVSTKKELPKGEITKTPSPIDDTPVASPKKAHTSTSVWTGSINMVDVAQISITAHEVSGDCSGLRDELPQSLDIVGRISPETVWDYISKMRCSNSKIISILKLNATNMEEKMPYIALYSYLSSRNRLGVVKSTNKAVKDFYILPLGSNSTIPSALFPISGPGFEEHRPPLLVGIIVRDRRKRPLLDAITNAVMNKRMKVEAVTPTPVVTTGSVTPPIPTAAPARSYTPPPSRDPRIKQSYTAAPPTALPPPSPPAASTADEDEPYSPEDSDPEATTPPLPVADPAKLTNTLNLLGTTNTNSSFLTTGLPTPFKPFSKKFDDIPGLGLDEPAALPASSLELQRKMAELDQRIAMQKAEIHHMSQDIVSSASAADIGSSALANIAIPNNLQQILESIKIIGAAKNDTEAQPNEILSPAQSDLTIPLMLPKLSSRQVTGQLANQKTEGLSPTIPLNLPKMKIKFSATNSPQKTVEEKPTSSVLSSLSEEDLIRKAQEMLGEAEPSSPPSKKKKTENEKSSFVPTLFTQPPPPIMTPAPPRISSPSLNVKRIKIDLSQPPIPGLEDEC